MISEPCRALNPSLVSVLETFAHYPDVEGAFHAYRNAPEISTSDAEWLSQRIDLTLEEYAVLIIVGNRIGIAPPAFADVAYNLANASNVLHWNPEPARIEELYQQTRVADLTELSTRTLSVVSAICKRFEIKWTKQAKRLDEPEFAAAVEELSSAGLLTRPVKTIDFGDFTSLAPFCPDYGFTRGTPIDRYYLGRFVSDVKDQIIGEVLEIGGRRENQQAYGFTQGNSYSAMELGSQPGVDLVADAHDYEACAPESLDSIILFNVLEHCNHPALVLQNVFRWLRPGGKVFCVVPNAQRVHRDPKDYWRIYPDAFEAMLSDYTQVSIFTYGNLVSVRASLSGICAEELSPDHLDYLDKRYPVITCAIAQKPTQLGAQ